MLRVQFVRLTDSGQRRVVWERECSERTLAEAGRLVAMSEMDRQHVAYASMTVVSRHRPQDVDVLPPLVGRDADPDQEVGVETTTPMLDERGRLIRFW
jgi:hypothetical protein